MSLRPFSRPLRASLRQLAALLSLLLPLLLLSFSPLSHGQSDEPTFGSSTLDYLRVFNTAQGVDQAWDRPGHDLALTVPYAASSVRFKGASLSYWQQIVIAINNVRWNAGIYGDDYKFHFSGDINLDVGVNHIAVVAEDVPDAIPPETYNFSITRTAPSSVTALSGLLLSGGASLSPAVAANVLSYSADVTSAVSSLTVTPSASDFGTVTVNGHSADTPVTLAVGSNTITIVVTAQDGVTSKTYTLTVNRADPANDLSLANVTLVGVNGSSTSFAPDFASDHPSANVLYATSSFTVSPTAANGSATITVDGNPVANGGTSGAITLSGSSTTVSIVVTAADGNSSRTYTLTVNRAAPASDARLTNLQVSGNSLGDLYPTFSSDTLSYNVMRVYVPGQSADIPSVNLTLSAANAYAVIKVNGTTVTSGVTSVIPLVMGSNTLTMRVTAEDGSTSRDYSLALDRSGAIDSTELGALSVSTGSLLPAFASAVTSYAVHVPEDSASITVTPSRADTANAGTTIRVNGSVVDSGSASAPISLDPGRNTITVRVTAANGQSTGSYTLTVTRGPLSSNAGLASLGLTGATLSPAFSATISSYRSVVAYPASSITLTPTSADFLATIKVNGNPVASGSAVVQALAPGNNAITVSSIAEDGITQRNYTLNVYRTSDYELNALGVGSGLLLPAFSPEVSSYHMNIGNAVSSLDFTLTSGGFIRVNGNQVANGASTTVNLNVGENIVTVQVYGNGSEITKAYQVTVVRGADPSQAGAALAFNRVTQSSPSVTAWRIASADFNGDGVADLVASRFGLAQNVVSFKGLAGQGFTEVASNAIASVGDVIAVGDFNGDGKSDLALLSTAYTGKLFILLGNGNGGFSVGATQNLGIYPKAVAVADWNGDGKADLVIGQSDTLAVFLGNGDGTFAAAVDLIGMGAIVMAVGSGDFNGDGKLDLVAVTDDRGVVVLLGRGDGGFASPQTFPAGGGTGKTLVVRDFNGDGALDLAIGHWEGGISVLLGQGNGNFSAPSFYNGPATQISLLSGDFNGDGQVDLVAVSGDSNNRNYAILLGAGGTFSGPTTLLASNGSADLDTVGIYDAVSADFNNDGKPDLAFALMSSGVGDIYLNLNSARALHALSLSAGTLTPAFDPAVANYSVSLAKSVASISLTPKLLFAGQSVTVNGVPVASGSASAAIALDTGNNSITVLVRAPNGDSESYLLNVYREPALAAPTEVSAVADIEHAVVSFTAPADDGGSPVLGYRVIANPPDGVDADAGSDSISHTITGLRGGVAYTFSVVAHNAIGNSLPSAASAAVSVLSPPQPEVPVTPTQPQTNISGSGHFTLNSNQPVSLADDAAGATLTIATVSPLSISMNGRTVGLQASSGSVLRIAQLTVNGKALLLPEVTSGQVQFTASSAGQILFSLAGGAVVASTADTVLTAGPGQLVVSRGAVHLPANAFAAGASADLYAGEVALLNAAGKVSRIRLGSADGSGNLAGDPINTAAAPANLSLKARIPRLSGSVARLPAGLEQTLATALGGSGQQNSSGSFNFSAESVLGLLPVGEIVIDASQADGVSLTNDGLARVVSSGVVVTLAPAPRDLHQFAGDLAQAFSGATLSVRDKGVMVARLAGVDYVFRPSAWVEPAIATAAFQQGSDGLLRYRDGRGGQQTLYPAFYDDSGIAAILSQLASGVSTAVQVDGSIVVRYGANTATLLPDWALSAAAPDNPPWWLGGDGKVYVNDGRVVQGMSVR